MASEVYLDTSGPIDPDGVTDGAVGFAYGNYVLAAEMILDDIGGAEEEEGPVTGVTQTSFTFRWDPSTDDHGILGYDVSMDQVVIGETDAPDRHFFVSGLVPSRSYEMRARAKDVDGLKSGWSEPLIVTTLDPEVPPEEPDAVPGWEPNFFMNLGDEDAENSQEADICVLDSGLVVTASLSTYSYGIQMRATNPATGITGPRTYVNNDWDGAADIPVDPLGMAIDDLSFIIPMGDTKFAMIGNASESYFDGELLDTQWHTADLSTAVFYTNGSDICGEYNAGVIRRIPANNIAARFTLPALADIVQSGGTYVIEMTIAVTGDPVPLLHDYAGSSYLKAIKTATETDFDTFDWRQLGEFTGGATTGVYTVTVGPGIESWNAAEADDFGEILFFPQYGWGAYNITQIRYRQTDVGTVQNVASWFEVDPDTLEIERVGFSTADWNLYYSDEVTAARWGTKLVILPEAIGDDDVIAIVDSEDYSVELIAGHTNAPGGGRNGPISVTGDWAVYAIQGSDLFSINLATQETNTLATDLGGYSEWAWHSCTLSDGRIAMIVTGFGADAVRDPLKLAMIEIDQTDGTIDVTNVYDLVAEADNVGWTGGWYSNCRSISAMPDDTLIIGYTRRTVTNAFHWLTVNPNSGAIIESGIVPGVYVKSTYTFTHQIAAYGQGEWAAMWLGAPDNDSDWGLYMSLHTLDSQGDGDIPWNTLDISTAEFFDDAGPYGQYEDGKISGAGQGSIVVGFPDWKLGTDFNKWDYIEVEVTYDATTGSTYTEIEMADPDWNGDSWYVGDFSQVEDELTVRIRTGPSVWDWDNMPYAPGSTYLWLEEEAVVTGVRWRVTQSVDHTVLHTGDLVAYYGPRSPVAWDGGNQHLYQSVTNNARMYSVGGTEDLTDPPSTSGFGYTLTSTSNGEYPNKTGFVRDGLVVLPLYVDAEATNKYQMAVIRPLDTAITLISRVPYPTQTFSASGFIRSWIVYPGYDQVFMYGVNSGTHAIEAWRSDIDPDGVISTPTSLGSVTYDNPGDIPGGGAYYFTNLHDAMVINSTYAMDDLRGIYSRTSPLAITDGYNLIPTTSGDSNAYDTFTTAPLANQGKIMCRRRNSGNTLTTKVLLLEFVDETEINLAETWVVPGGGAYNVIMGFSKLGLGVAYTYNSSGILLKGYYDIFGADPIEFTPPAGMTHDSGSEIVPTDPDPSDGTYDSWLVNLASGSNYAVVLGQFPLVPPG